MPRVGRSRLELDDFGIAVPGKVPSLDSGLATAASAKKNVNRHDEIKPAKVDVHSSVPDFVVRNSFNVGWQHAERLLINTPSRSTIEPLSIGLSNWSANIYLCPKAGRTR